MAMPVFDTHKAVKALCGAGFDDTQAEAVVDQINGAINENVATKTDLDRLPTREELRQETAMLATKADLERYATTEQLRQETAMLATKADLERYATEAKLREEIAKLATKEDLERCATKEQLRDEVAKLATEAELRQEIEKIDIKLDNVAERFELRLAVELKQQTNRILTLASVVAATFVGLAKVLDLLV